MAGGISDFIFGRGALKKAAGESSKPSSPGPSANLDIGKMAQESADRAKKAEASKPAAKKGPQKRATKR